MAQRNDLTAEVRDRVAREYQAGVKTLVLEYEYNISPGELYRILHRKGLTLRTAPVTAPTPAPAPSQPLRPKCNSCGRYYDPGLTKKGVPDRREKKCWLCTGYATEYRENREVYNKDGSKVPSREKPWLKL